MRGGEALLRAAAVEVVDAAIEHRGGRIGLCVAGAHRVDRSMQLLLRLPVWRRDCLKRSMVLTAEKY